MPVISDANFNSCFAFPKKMKYHRYDLQTAFTSFETKKSFAMIPGFGRVATPQKFHEDDKIETIYKTRRWRNNIAKKTIQIFCREAAAQTCFSRGKQRPCFEMLWSNQVLEMPLLAKSRRMGTGGHLEVGRAHHRILAMLDPAWRWGWIRLCWAFLHCLPKSKCGEQFLERHGAVSWPFNGMMF